MCWFGNPNPFQDGTNSEDEADTSLCDNHRATEAMISLASVFTLDDMFKPEGAV